MTKENIYFRKRFVEDIFMHFVPSSTPSRHAPTAKHNIGLLFLEQSWHLLQQNLLQP